MTAPADPAHVAALAGIRLLALQAQPETAEANQPARTDLDMRVGFESAWDDTDRLLRYALHYDLRQPTDGPTVTVTATYEVFFHMTDTFNDDAGVMQQFERTVVALAVHPYLRTLAAQLISNMGLTATPLPLLRPSNLHPIAADDQRPAYEPTTP